MRFSILRAAVGFAVTGFLGCGGRTATFDHFVDGATGPRASDEACNAIDDDLDGRVDEGFRDEIGRYTGDDDCGACGTKCVVDQPHQRASHCILVDDVPRCAATSCEPGFGVSRDGVCVASFDHLCLPCQDGGGCGVVATAACIDIAGEQRCTIKCDGTCTTGYTCSADGYCIPEGGSCSCEASATFSIACALKTPSGEDCVGRQTCDRGRVSPCSAPPETCDTVDNDCDGAIDEGFRDGRGTYSLDVHNCGQCGVDCAVQSPPGTTLACGGDPFAPKCVLSCPDSRNGVAVGDRLDADLNAANGCECTVTLLADAPGPTGASDQQLDVNCDGADGVVVESFYVAADGRDDAVGSPTRPLKTIGEALRRARASLDTTTPRPHVFVAGGVYTEALELPDGVKLHGGYRRDFRSLDPAKYRVDVRAPAASQFLGGAALSATGAGVRETVVEGLSVQGVDAVALGAAAVGAVLVDPGPNLRISSVEIRAGVPGDGVSGLRGSAGRAAATKAADGAAPRAATEDAQHQCIVNPSNRARGGVGAYNRCADFDVSGGDGGSSTCPTFAVKEASGANGLAASGVGGVGGAGGTDAQGPIQRGPACNRAVCCGLADINVPGNSFTGAEPGRSGIDGAIGQAGQGCSDVLGSFVGSAWTPGASTPGGSGQPGTGGGGGGAGGGVRMDWFNGRCEFADGLGGGGGGGGAGGCGGAGGVPGGSGGPSIALLVRYSTSGVRAPTFERVTFSSRQGGRGGSGGAGGDGGGGSAGGLGRSLSPESLTTPTLAGAYPGGRGGKGGNGGAGGAGGGGCGGSSVGIWVDGLKGSLPVGADAWRANGNVYSQQGGGPFGRGGGGVAPSSDGATGGVHDVISR